ncbi:hypothetical protein GCM10009737_25190 [Nocardioides lentus]|uniref:Uncharacterized protein n=1 Tax=Nocardioides lentus TaxID=338077 RepID=A0ABP5AU77_9ACTN
MGTAGVETAVATVRGPAPPVAAGAASATEPQARHSPHRPTHLPVSHPHSAHRKTARARACLLMTGTLGDPTDNDPRAGAGLGTTARAAPC